MRLAVAILGETELGKCPGVGHASSVWSGRNAGWRLDAGIRHHLAQSDGSGPFIAGFRTPTDPFPGKVIGEGRRQHDPGR